MTPFPVPPPSLTTSQLTHKRGRIREPLVAQGMPSQNDNQVDGILDKILSGMKRLEDIPEQERDKYVNMKRLPSKLVQQLESTGDLHVKLNYLLNYKTPLKVQPYQLEHVLALLGVENAEDVCDLLSEKLMLQVVKYQLNHKNFDYVAKIVKEIVISRNSGIGSEVENLSFIIFNTLKSDYDLKFGFMDLMKSLYELLEHQHGIFKFMFTALTENGHALVRNEYDLEFEDIWKMLQLCQIIDSVPEVKILPEPYWKSGYDYVNLQLGIKCFQASELERGYSHIRRNKVVEMDGVIYRIIQAGRYKNELSANNLIKPTNFESKVLRMVISKPDRSFSPLDIKKLAGFTKNLNVLNNSVKDLDNNNSIFELKNMILKKMLASRNVKFSVNMVKNNLDQVYKFDVSLLATVFKISHDSDLLSQVIPKLPYIVRSCFISTLLKQELTIKPNTSKESKIPETQFQRIEWVLDAVNYEITDMNFKEISPLLTRLPLNLQKRIISKLSGIHFPIYVDYLSSGIPLSSTLIPIMINTGKCRTRPELEMMAKYIAESCSTEEIVYILSGIKEQLRFDSLHLKIIIRLIKQKQPAFDKAQQIIDKHPYDKSKFYLNQELLKQGHTPINYSDAYVSNPKQLVKLQTLEKLLDDSKLGYSSSLRKHVGYMIHNNMFDQTLAILLLKKIVKKIKSNGEFKETERFRWGVELCKRYGVSASTISDIVES